VASRYSTLVLVSQLQSELERVLNEAAGTRELAEPGWHAPDAPPPVDILETKENLVITMEVPGLEATDLVIEINGYELALRGSRRPTGVQDTAVRFHCMERSRGTFERLLRIDDTVDPRDATAKLAQGVLTLELPKLTHERRGSFQVRVQTED